MSRGRWAFGLTTLAVLCGLAVLPLALLLPVYDGSSASSSSGAVTVVTHSSATLVAENGAPATLLMLLAIPGILAGLAWLGMHRTCRRGGDWGRRVAGTAIVLLGLLTFVTGFTIGPELLPCLALLIVGMALTPTAT